LLDITEINRRVRVASATGAAGLGTIAPFAAENFTETVFFPYNSASR
jgi:hypothetical protein